MSSKGKKVEIVFDKNKRRVFKENGRFVDGELDPITRGVIDSRLGLIIENIKGLENATSKSKRKEIADNIFALVKDVDSELEMDWEIREKRWFKSVENEKLKNNNEFEKLVFEWLSFRHPSLVKEKKIQKQKEINTGLKTKNKSHDEEMER